VIHLPTRRRAPYALAGFLVAALSIAAQTSTPTSGPAIPLRDEGHHHLIFHNSYVNVFFVEIPPHETTLPHHHDLPYISVPPGGSDARPDDKKHPQVGYSPGNFSHAVTNSSDVTLHNIAIELVRPQGTIRNYCSVVAEKEPQRPCLTRRERGDRPNSRWVEFGSDEIVVESWYFDQGKTTDAFDDPSDMLIAGMNGVSISGRSGLDSANALRGGVLWVPAGSNPVFKTALDHDGHFIAITFKDGGGTH
jgi:hypothetical protein